MNAEAECVWNGMEFEKGSNKDGRQEGLHCSLFRHTRYNQEMLATRME